MMSRSSALFGPGIAAAVSFFLAAVLVGVFGFTKEMSHRGGWSRGSSSGRSESRSSDTRASNTGGDVVDSNHARTADIVRKKLKVENGNLVESNAISRQSTLIFKQLIHKDGDTWLHIPNDHKLRYFKEFKKYFEWDPEFDSEVFNLWLKKSSLLYTNMLYKQRKTGKRPPYVSQSIWSTWNAKWESDDYKKKSEIAKRNRLTEPAGPGTGISIHRGGTRSAYEHGLQLLKEGTPASQLNCAVFHKLHCQNGVYDNEKSASIGATIIRQRNELSQPTSENSESGEVDTNDITVNATGGVSKKGRMYGLGSQGNAYIAASSSKSLTRPTSETALRQRIADLEAKLITQATDSQAQIEAQTQKYEALQARVDAQEANLQKKFESMFATFMASSRHPTSP